MERPVSAHKRWPHIAYPLRLPVRNSDNSFGSIFPPLITATLLAVFGSSEDRNDDRNMKAATVTAPLGSATV